MVQGRFNDVGKLIQLAKHGGAGSAQVWRVMGRLNKSANYRARDFFAGFGLGVLA